MCSFFFLSFGIYYILGTQRWIMYEKHAKAERRLLEQYTLNNDKRRTRTRTFSHVHVYTEKEEIYVISKREAYILIRIWSICKRILNFQRWSSNIRQINKVFEHFVTEQLSNRWIHIIIYIHVIVIILLSLLLLLLLLFYSICKIATIWKWKPY